MAEAGEVHWWYRSTRALLMQLLEPHIAQGPGALHLDAAGGTGATGSWLAARAPTVLADFDQFAVEIGRRDQPGYLPALADLNHLPFANDSFDTVLCITALCHRMNPDPAAIVRDFVRVAKPGAMIALMEPGGKRLWRSHDEVTHTGRRFSVADLRTMAEDSGLEIVKVSGAYSFLVPAAFVLGIVERNRAKSDVGRNQSGLGGVLGALAAVERRLLRRINLPVGLSAIVVARKPAAVTSP